MSFVNIFKLLLLCKQLHFYITTMQSVAMLRDQPLLPVTVTLPTKLPHAQSSTIVSGNDLNTKDDFSQNNMINARFLLGTQVFEVPGLFGEGLGEVQLPVQLTVVLG